KYNIMEKHIDRRIFIEKSTKGMAGAGIVAAVSCSSSEKAELGKQFIHHVFFWLKDPSNKEARDKFEKAARELVTVETILDFHIGVPAPTDREVIDTTYSYSVLTTYRNKEDQDIYQTHPKHLKFIEDCQELWEKVVVYDSVSI
ncbi:MAG TPA: stress protein, partial [Bacteroidales bacterium]|nr:stress protein [Bacteroidales bacterium]HBQ82903.1 stress protein [Bacteroidales bacterium]HCU19478.1 stress protein [Bacteroidales bacterium]